MKDGTWKRVPDDTIHWGQHARRSGDLFIYFMTGMRLASIRRKKASEQRYLRKK